MTTPNRARSASPGEPTDDQLPEEGEGAAEDGGLQDGGRGALCERDNVAREDAPRERTASLSLLAGSDLLRSAHSSLGQTRVTDLLRNRSQFIKKANTLELLEAPPTCPELTRVRRNSCLSSGSEDGAVGRSRCSTTLYDDALDSTPSPVDSMHPARAEGGLLLLQRAKENMKEQGLEHDDGTATVRRLFFDSVPEACVEIGRMQQVLQPRLLRQFLRRVAKSHASVEATFHGTKGELVKGIMERGLTPSLCTTGAYGRGAYVGTHAGIAHQYADPDGRGWRHMCVVLVSVGRDVCKGQEGVQVGVTSMDRLRNPTQYCFVDETRLYVSHVITYRVTNSLGRRVGGGCEDPFQRQLNLALVRATQSLNKSGVR